MALSSPRNLNGHFLGPIKSNEDEDVIPKLEKKDPVRRVGRFKLRGKTDDLPQYVWHCSFWRLWLYASFIEWV